MLKIKISQWKGKRDKFDHKILEFAARYFTRELLGPHMASRLDYHIRLRPEWTDFGSVFLDYGKSRQRDFEIRIKQDEVSMMLFMLAHEIVHVEQRVRNRIVISDRDNGQKVCFNGEEFLVDDGDDETSLPWELEAVTRGDELIDSLMEHMDTCEGLII